MVKKRIALMLGAALMTLGGAAAVQAEEAPENCIRDISYIEDGNEDHMLDVYGEDGITEAMPTIIEVHGGGFFGGTKETNMDHSQYYAEHDFLVVTPNYTHMPASGGFKSMIQEIFASMEWVSENAEEYHFDLDNMFMGGDSAGGFLVQLTAAVISSEELQEYYEVTPPDFEIKGYILSCPVTDIMELQEELTSDNGFMSFAAQQIGEDILMNQDIMEHADLYSITDPETMPELYIITTPSDALLYEETAAYEEFLRENGYAYEYHVYESQENQLNHVFNISDVSFQESIQANDDSIAYMKGLCGSQDEETTAVACVGDSITFGFGVMETRETDAYPVLLQELLGDGYEVANYGKPGACVQEDGSMPYKSMDEYTESVEAAADIYLLMLGTNDAREEYWDAAAYGEELTELAEEYQSLGEDTQVYLMVPPAVYVQEGKDEVGFDIDQEILENEVCGIVRETAEKMGLPLIDLYTFTENHGEWFKDGVHPNLEGNENIAEYIFEAIKAE